ncbi:hypothetical protein [Curtobacterium sp. MCPF17_052]|uniref:hypothetical protein n=1 Tax=Curtobacterium sp. MCPF17_052 TaxID=2175655 RepID=UPI0024DF7309|nr:hypothetical protein [Curtobacterium sp. MCPF17_052]WIB12195.1 hypothetical protein DEJ36_15835 [Curtobacterium sp. MCPF17_052]
MTHDSAVLRVLLADPVLTEAAISAALPPDLPWTDAVIDDLVAAGVLRPVTERRRDRAWVASDVLAELDALAERIRAAVVPSTSAAVPADSVVDAEAVGGAAGPGRSSMPSE